MWEMVWVTMKPGQESVYHLRFGTIRLLFPSQRTPALVAFGCSPCAFNKLFITERQEVEPSPDGGRTLRNSENEANQERSGRIVEAAGTPSSLINRKAGSLTGPSRCLAYTKHGIAF